MKAYTKKLAPVLLALTLLVALMVIPANAAWQQDSNGWYYTDAQGQRLKNVWQKDSVGWCWLDANGYMVTNTWVQDSKGWCYIGPNGYCLTNCWQKDSVGWVYLDAEGSMVYNKWIKDSKGWCYVGSNGYMVYNQWVKDSKGWCYVDGSGYMVYDQWVKDSKGWCYVGKDGYMVYDQWVKDSKGWCYVDGGGYMVYNQWVKDSKGWCYVGKDGYMVTNAWVEDSKGWCYIGENGYAVTNCWQQDSTGWCYLDSNGSMVKNEWLKDGGNWYYLNNSGYMVTGWQNIGSDRYYFYSSGIMAANTTVDGVTIGADGRAQSVTPVPQPDPDKPTTAPATARLTIGLPRSATVLDIDSNALTQWLEQETGYELEFVLFSSYATDAISQLSVMMATGQKLPDILLGFPLNSKTLNTFAKEGYLQDLTPYFRDTEGASQIFWSRVADDLSEEELSYVMSSILNVDSGTIYSIPTVEKSSANQQFQPYINQAWLDKLGLSTPTNTSELYAVLKAFKEQDPNGNGRKDEIPLIGFTKAGATPDVVSWLINMFLYYDAANPYQVEYYNEVTPDFTSEEYRQALAFVSKLYKEDLLSSSSFTLDASTLQHIAFPASGDATCGIIVGNMDTLAAEDNAILYEYAALPLWGCVPENTLTCKSNVFISGDCDVPSAAFKLLMTLWSEEGSVRMRYGEYGVNWIEADPGSKSAYGLDAKYKVISDPKDTSNTANWGILASCCLPYADGEDVQVDADVSEWTQKKNALKAQTLANYERACSSNNPNSIEITPVLSNEALEETASARAQIKTICQQALIEFVTGSKDVNNEANWNAYLTNLEEAGLSSYVKHLQASFDNAADCLSPVGHFYRFNTCTTDGKCVFCNDSSASAHGHNFVGETCSYCGAVNLR